jgi:hypothetical protein
MKIYLIFGNNINAFHYMVMRLLGCNDTAIQCVATFIWCGSNTNVFK